MRKISTEASTLVLALFDELDHIFSAAFHLIAKENVAADGPVSTWHSQMLTREVANSFWVFGLVELGKHFRVQFGAKFDLNLELFNHLFN